MRIIAGKYGGRNLTRPKTTATRPMSDKVRAALFDVIGPIDGWDVLDLYSGSGAIAIEALSRGAKLAVAVENSREPLRAIRASQLELGIGPELLVLGMPDTKALLKLEISRFNLVIADPPYDSINEAVLSGFSSLITPNGLIIVSHTSRIAPPELESMQQLQTRKYGDSSLSFYRTLSS